MRHHDVYEIEYVLWCIFGIITFTSMGIVYFLGIIAQNTEKGAK